MFINRIKKLVFAVVLTLSLGFAYLPSSASAASVGSFSASPYSGVDFTSACQTGYPYIVFDIYKTSGYSGQVTMQRYSSGSWQDLPGTTYTFSNHTTIKVAAWSSSTLYRVKVKNGWHPVSLNGYGSCKGSN